MSKFIFILLISFVFSQTIVETRQFSYYYNNDSSKIDFKDIIKNYNGNYKVELISIDNIYFERTKKIMIEQCDLKFDIANNPEALVTGAMAIASDPSAYLEKLKK